MYNCMTAGIDSQKNDDTQTYSVCHQEKQHSLVCLGAKKPQINTTM